MQNAIGLKWPKEPAEDTLVGPRYPESESGEPLINAFKSMDSTDEAVLDSGRFLVILADGRGLWKLECGRSITVDLSEEVAVDGGPPQSDPGFRWIKAK